MTVAAPSGIQDGDLLVCIQTGYKAGGPATQALAAGFTGWNQAVANTDYKTRWGYKRASSESGSYVFNCGADSTKGAVILAVYRGCIASGDPQDVHFVSSYTTNDTDIECQGVTPTTDDMFVWSAMAQGSSQTITLPTTATFTQRATVTAGDVVLKLGDTWRAAGTAGPGAGFHGTAGVATQNKSCGIYGIQGVPAVWTDR